MYLYFLYLFICTSLVAAARDKSHSPCHLICATNLILYNEIPVAI